LSNRADINAFSAVLARRLQSIYGNLFSESHVNRITRMIQQLPPRIPLWDESDVLLISYGNSIYNKDEKPLVTLQRFLHAKLGSVFRCIHILPFFPSTSDDGFAVQNYDEVDPLLGNWHDIEKIGEEYDLMFDLVLNHVSSSHRWFSGFLKNEAPYRDYFIGKKEGADYIHVVRPRSSPLFTRVKTATGEKEVWTTFSADQADLNFANPDVLIEIVKVLLLYLSKGARIIRLDAIAFAWKEEGTTCLHHRNTHEIVKLLRDIADYVKPGVIILTETNVPNAENLSYFGTNDEARMIYQFTLPPLILYTLYNGSSASLTNWAQSIPETDNGKTFLNFTASHDGIGLRPLEGILPTEEVAQMIDCMQTFGGKVSMKSNPDGTESPYELNITWFSALCGTKKGRDTLSEQRFLASQAIMIAMRGIPAFYIHSLFGTENDFHAVEMTGMSRSINRHQWDEEELLQKLSGDNSTSRIFSAIQAMIRIRSSMPAFHPDARQRILHTGDPFFAVERDNRPAGQRVLCITNVTDTVQPLDLTQMTWNAGFFDTLGNKEITSGKVTFQPYQTRWIV
jgi:sucrose phosphorylase